ncbi:unnamed protein product [Caenorhabditis nigoni]
MMICDEWNKFIQVNIYGHTLQGLQQQGVVLEALLNNVGCSKLWIVEGSMYRGESFDQSTIESEGDITVPVLSTTIADVKCPRFSTPAVSQNELQRKFTLNLPVKYSEINSSFEEDGLSMEPDENDDVIVELLSELVDKASDKIPQEESPAKKTAHVLSTTNADVPRYSTPISSEIDQDEIFTLNMPEILSDIESNDEDAIVTGVMDPEVQCPSEEDRKREYGRSVSTVKSPTRRSRRLSAPYLKIKVKREAEGEEEPKTKRPALTKSTSEAQRPGGSGFTIKIKKCNTIDPKLLLITSPDKNDNQHGELMDLEDQRSDDQYMDAASLIELKPITNFQFSDPEPFAQVPVKREVSMDQMVNYQADISYGMDYGDAGDAGDFEEDDDNFFSTSDNDTMLMAVESESQSTKYTPPPPHMISTKSILRSQTASKAKKTVSFGVAKNKMSEKQKKLDQTHRIECRYEGCGKVMNWKIRYGKQRLLDHVFTHFNDKCIVCRICEQSFGTSEQIRYHCKKAHPEVKGSKFRILDVFNLEMDDVTVTDLFNECYEPQLPIIGKVGKIKNLRRKCEKKTKGDEEKGQDESDEEEEDVNNIPGPSNMFYFRRIR